MSLTAPFFLLRGFLGALVHMCTRCASTRALWGGAICVFSILFGCRALPSLVWGGRGLH